MHTTSNLYVQLGRGFSVFLMFALLGMIAVVIASYWKAAFHGGALARHVVLIAVSYVGFILSTSGRSLQLLLQGRSIYSWTIFTVPFATIVGILALNILLRDIRRRQSHGHVRRSSDPA